MRCNCRRLVERGLAIAMVGSAGARAGPVQLVGELTIRNQTDQRPPGRDLFMLPGGTLEFTYSLFVGAGEQSPTEMLGQTRLGPEFWPEPGESHTGLVMLDFMTPALGIVEEDPLRVDGVPLVFGLEAPFQYQGLPKTGRTSFLGVPLDSIGSTQDFFVSVPDRRGGVPIGDGSFRLDAIVPEPTSVALFLTAVFVGGASRTVGRSRKGRNG